MLKQFTFAYNIKKLYKALKKLGADTNNPIMINAIICKSSVKNVTVINGGYKDCNGLTYCTATNYKEFANNRKFIITEILEDDDE